MKILFLGTSSLEAIPRVGDKCPQCTSNDPRDIRSRSAILINKKILIDAGPDVLAQLPKSWIAKIKAVFITHSHEDAAGGLGELLKFGKFRLFLSKETLRDINDKYQITNAQCQILKDRDIVRVGLIKIQAVKVPHSKLTTTFGYLVNNKFLYIQDISDTKPILPIIKRVSVVAIDGSMFLRNFGGHQAMVKTIKMFKPLKNLKTVFFTHIGHSRIPHVELEKRVQKLGGERFKVAYDLLEIRI